MADLVQLTPSCWINLDHIAYVRDVPTASVPSMILGLAVAGYGPAFDGHAPYELRLSPHQRTAMLAYLGGMAARTFCEPEDQYPEEPTEAPAPACSVDDDEIPF